MKPLVLTPTEWIAIRKEIDKNHPRSVTMVRWKMREVLGFTPREHRTYYHQTGTTVSIYLDFYEEKHRTMFLLKYGNGRD